MACSGTVICVQFTRSPMGTVVNFQVQGQSRRQSALVLQRAGHSIRWQQAAICTAFSANIKLVIAFAEQICARGPAEATRYLQNASPGVRNVGGCVIPVQIQTRQTRSPPRWYEFFWKGHAHGSTFNAFPQPCLSRECFRNGARMSAKRDVSSYMIKSSCTAKLKHGSTLHCTGCVLLQTVQACITGWWCLPTGRQIRS